MLIREGWEVDKIQLIIINYNMLEVKNGLINLNITINVEKGGGV